MPPCRLHCQTAVRFITWLAFMKGFGGPEAPRRGARAPLAGSAKLLSALIKLYPGHKRLSQTTNGYCSMAQNNSGLGALAQRHRVMDSQNAAGGGSVGGGAALAADRSIDERMLVTLSRRVLMQIMAAAGL